MVNLVFRSVLVLAILFGLLFGVGMAVLTYLDASMWIAAVFALGIIFLQYLLGPWILQWIFKIEWPDPQAVDPQLADFIAQTCAERGIPVPRFGIVRDGNPNAFTFGHYPADARLVVTTGLLEMLDAPERNAVVAHELGHIAHWDFVVVTLAAAVPLLLYIVYRATLTGGSRGSSRRGRGGGKGGDYAAIVGAVSFVVYIISHYIVLLLSRVREYYADQFAGEVTGNPDALSSALVKVAYGLASAPKDKKKDDTRMVAVRPLGIFDPRVAQTLALASAGSGQVSAEAMESAMRWDLWNPWAFFFELSSSHPLPAKRIRALERQSEVYGKPPRFSFRAVQPESYWDEFLVDVLINYLPLIGFLVGAALAGVAIFSWGQNYGALGIPLLLMCVGAWAKRRFSYLHVFDEGRTVRSLVGEVKVSGVRSIPCTIEGEIIGRGVPGLFYSEDLVLQDESGFMVVDYRQPIRLFEFFFGWLKAGDLIGRRGRARGWYRRAPSPRFEMRVLEMENGERVKSFYYPFTQFFIYAGMVAGAVLTAIQFVV